MKYPSLFKRILTSMLVVIGLGFMGTTLYPQPAHAAANVTFLKSVNASTANAGDTVSYTITATNSGDTAASGITVNDDLSDILDDATYNNDAAVTSGPGAVTYTDPTLNWTGDLNIGQTATITFTVTIKDPVPGNASLANKLVSNQGNCQTGSTDLRCAKTTSVSRVEFSKTADTSTLTPGSTVNYTITARSTGTADAGNVSLTDSLADVIDDAAYNNNAQLTGPGAIAYSSPDLTYSVNILSVGQTATITYSVTVGSPPAGNQVLKNTLVSNQGNCQTGSTDTACSVTVGQATGTSNITVSKTASVQSVAEGGTVTYTVIAHNNGTAAGDATFTDNLSGVLDDATFTEPITESGPIDATFAGSTMTLTVTNLAPGADATATYTVTVNSPDTGDRQLRNILEGLNCPTGTISSECRTTTSVTTPGTPNVTVSKTASASQVEPGKQLTYTITTTNNGTVAAQGFTLSDSLSDVLDDAVYNNDVVPTSGTVTYTEPNLAWQGDLQPNQTITLTYSVAAKAANSGNGQVINTVVSPATISNCVASSSDPQCKTTTTVKPASTGGGNPAPVGGGGTPGPAPSANVPDPKLVETGESLPLILSMAGGSIIAGIAAVVFHLFRRARRYTQHS